MQERVAAVRAGTAQELVWLVEHPPLYTAGTSARPEDLTAPARFPCFATGRGGQWTYHGPGQRVAYVMLDLTARMALPGRDVRCYVHALEAWLIRALARFDVAANGGKAASASGPRITPRGPKRRSPQSVCACPAGSAGMASR